MLLKRSLLALLVLSFLLVTSCQKDPEVIESQVLAEYLESTDSPLGKDYVNTDLPSIMAASEVKTLNETGQVYIIDLRSAADFATGYIQNAHNVALSDLVNHIKGVELTPYTKVALVCYTGQTAGFATALLRLMGYDKAFSMKFGMCAWHTDFAGRWNTTVANGNAYASQFVTTPTEKGPAGALPTLATGKTTGQEILEARITDLLTEGWTPASITSATVFGNLSSYYIVNYWPANHYEIGHIPGAMQYTPKASLKLDADLKTLPTDKTIVLYCYSGQTSAFLAAYLRLLGYDAKSLLFGTNGMIYDIMKNNNLTIWKESEVMNYDYIK
ncbi:MAG: rhodanese-like domain-containing protein [Bacteroidales bacterium]